MGEGRGLEGRVAIVTGAGSGIGRATAAKMIRECARVALFDVFSDRLDRVVGEFQGGGGEALGLVVDVRDQAAVARAVTQTAELWGGIDILVNNAGLSQMASFEEIREADWDEVVAVNLKGSFFCAQSVVPHMKREGRGRIVNIGSRAGLGKPNRTAYSATKAGLVGMTRTMALELAGFGITVNCVAPGPIATELFAAVNPPDALKTRELIQSIPLGRLGTPEDVANAVAFLASDEASFITGQTVYVCGGLTVGIAP